MQLLFSYIFPIVLFISVGTGLPNKNRNTRDAFEAGTDINTSNDWLSELESQILTNSEEVRTFLSTDSKNKVPPEVNPENKNHAQNEPVDEPIVVTSKAYLTGEEIDKSDKELDEFNEDNSTTNAPGEIEIETESSVDKKKTTTLTFKGINAEERRRIEDSTNDEMKTQNDFYNKPDVDDENNSRKILDKILNKPNNTFGTGTNSTRPREGVRDGESEVKSFVVLIKNQTPFIILGCIMSSLVFIALILFAYQILKKLHERSAITLISHHEYGDTNTMNKSEKWEIIEI